MLSYCCEFMYANVLLDQEMSVQPSSEKLLSRCRERGTDIHNFCYIERKNNEAPFSVFKTMLTFIQTLERKPQMLAL